MDLSYSVLDIVVDYRHVICNRQCILVMINHIKAYIPPERKPIRVGASCWFRPPTPCSRTPRRGLEPQRIGLDPQHKHLPTWTQREPKPSQRHPQCEPVEYSLHRAPSRWVCVAHVNFHVVCLMFVCFGYPMQN